MIVSKVLTTDGSYTLVFLECDDDLIRLGRAFSIDDVNAFRNNFRGRRPILRGCVYKDKRVIFLALAGAPADVVDTMCYEVGRVNAGAMYGGAAMSIDGKVRKMAVKFADENRAGLMQIQSLLEDRLSELDRSGKWKLNLHEYMLRLTPNRGSEKPQMLGL